MRDKAGCDEERGSVSLEEADLTSFSSQTFMHQQTFIRHLWFGIQW